uniref:Uncharacterized protein n=1 Tax=Anguilla anguilla TaxID=7936 RepID=A0A0E9VLY0_ANGAN
MSMVSLRLCIVVKACVHESKLNPIRFVEKGQLIKL